ncbi:MAG: mechanosensitive ion channel family protein, partial [Rhodothermales bacterium]
MSPQRLLQNERFQQFLSEGPGTALLVSALIVLGAFVLSRMLKRIIPRYIDDPDRRYRASKLTARLVGFAAVVAIVFVWSSGDGPGLATILTLIGAGLAIALREVVLSFVAWINIVIHSPFEQGDRIEINGIQGDVIDIRLLHSTLMETGGWVNADQSTGRIVHFPNGWLYQYGIYNYTHGFRFLWNEIPFTITFRSDWNAAREIMLDLASETAEIVEQQVKREIQQMSREYLVHYSILTPFVYVRVTSNGVQLTLRYLAEARKRRGTEHALTMSILNAFRDHGQIELAYGMVGVAQMDSPQFGPMPGPGGRTGG